MSLQELIDFQVRDGEALCVGGDNILCSAVGRKEAQEAFDAPAIKAQDDESVAQQAVIDAAKEQRDALVVVAEPDVVFYLEPEDPENITAEEAAAQDAYSAYTAKVRVYNTYFKKLNSLKRAEKIAIKRKSDSVKGASNIRSSHENMGPTRKLYHDPKAAIIRSMIRFITANAGAKASRDCKSKIEAYLEANPSATLVKINNFENSPAMICTAEGVVVVRVDFTVSGV